MVNRGFWSNLFISFIGLFGGRDDITPAQNRPLMTTTMPMVPITAARSCPIGFLGDNCQIECGLSYHGSQSNSAKQLQNTLNRIVGGTVAVANSWPAHVYVSIRFDGYVYLPEQGVTVRQQQGFACGGTLISPSYVLTAAHCILDELNFEYKGSFYTVPVKVDPAHYSVYMGMQNKAQRQRSPTVRATVARVIQHEDYSKLTVQNDIALLKLSEPVELTEGIQVACLPQSTDAKQDNALKQTYSNQPAWAVGWGTTSYSGSTSDQLRQVGLSIYNTSMCKFVQGRKNWSAQICAGEYNGGKDTCQGDSGGPLYTLDENFKVGGGTTGEGEGEESNTDAANNKGGSSTTKYVVAGITSYGDGCAQRYSPGIYTKVSAYVNWIKSKEQEVTADDKENNASD